MQRANPRWRRQRLSALVKSQLFGFVGILVQKVGSANPALRLSFSVKRDASAASVSLNGARDFIEQRLRLGATRPSPPPNCSMKPTSEATPPTSLRSPHCGAAQPPVAPHLGGAAYLAPRSLELKHLGRH